LVELLISKKIFYVGEVVSRKSQELGLEMVLSGKPLTGRWRQEYSSGYGEEIMRHPSLCWFGDFGLV